MRALKRAWIPLLVFALSVPAAELAFRLAGMRTGKGAEAAFVKSEHAGYRLRPDHVAELPWYPSTFKIQTNRLGFRVHENTRGWTPDQGPLDIMLVGDSLVVGSRIDYEYSFAGIFTEKANAEGLTVANLAVNGHYLGNQVKLLRWLHETEGVKPRLLVVGITVYGIGSAGNVYEPYVAYGALWSKKPTSRVLAQAWVAQNFATYSVLRNAGKQLTHRGVTGDAVRGYKNDHLANQEPKVLAMLRELKDICGSRLVLVYYPDSFFERVDTIDETASSDNVAAFVERLAGTLDAKFIDMRPPLRKVLETGESLGMVDDPHYTPAANAAVGEALWGAFDWKQLGG